MLAVSVALAFSASVASAECAEGTWRGTLGKQAVSLEINSLHTRGDTLAGRYYRGASLDELILLPVVGQPGTWAERDTRGRRTGVLRLACADGRLTGTRTPAIGGALERLAVTRIDSDAYPAARLADLKLRVTRLVMLDERRGWQEFTVAGVKEVQGLRFLGPGVAALNETLFKAIKDSLEELLSGRVAGYLDQGPDHRHYRQDRSEVLAFGDQLIAIDNHSEGFSGGVHGYVTNDVQTWNLVTQQWEDVSKWLDTDWFALVAAGEADPDEGAAIAPQAASDDAQDGQAAPASPASALRRFLDASSREDREDCRDVVTVEFDREHMWAQAEGLGVQPETRGYGDRLCAVPFTIPYELVWPYLTQAGRRHAGDLIRSPRPNAYGPL
jgi:hypothetical protein